MNENGKPLELLKLLELEEGAAAGERMRRWAEAFEGWMEERRTRFSLRVGPLSYTAWQEFLAFIRRPPWEARTADVDAYLESLKKRKLRPATMKSRLTALSKFYEYCRVHQIDPECEEGFNPVAGTRRPKMEYYEKANFLSRKEEAALLDAIRQDPSPMGKRDYALLLMLLRTGWKAAKVRQLKWGDVSGDGENRSGAAAENAARKLGGGDKGEGDKGALPEEVWEALRESLEATGRWEGIQPEEYVFAPSRAPLIQEARERAQDWDGSRPLSKDELLYLVKLHAGRAGLKAKKINTRTLRHTAAMRQVEAGASPEAVRVLLGRVRPHDMKAYLRRLAEKPKGRLRARKQAEEEIWPGIPADLGQDNRPGSGQIPSRGPFRAGPRNHLALKHGFYARYLPEFEWLAELGFRPKGLDGAVVRWRVVMQRAAILGNDVTTLKEGLRVLKILGRASVRLCKALMWRRKLRDEEREREWEEYLRGRSE
jgi:integrase